LNGASVLWTDAAEEHWTITQVDRREGYRPVYVVQVDPLSGFGLVPKAALRQTFRPLIGFGLGRFRLRSR